MSPETLNIYALTAIELSMAYIPRLALALITLIVGFKLVRVVHKVMHKALNLQHVDVSLVGFLESLVSLILKGLVIITVAGMVGIEMTSFVALIGAAGLAIGLSLQGSLANFAGGVLILLFKPFTKGDVIEAQGFTGIVDRIEIVNTILIKYDNKVVVIPNGELSNGAIINHTRKKTRRVEHSIGIGYGDSIKEARDVILAIVSADKRVQKDPESVVVVDKLGDNAVELIVRSWVKTEDYWGVYHDQIESIKNELDTAGIDMPFPQRDVHLYQAGNAN